MECSPFEEGTAYVSIDRHRHDDRKPYLFRTTDRGKTWQALASGLPAEGPIHVIRADPRNRDLLFVGTEFGLFVSLDGGGKWHRFGKGLPTVAVHDLVIHPRDRELVVATHGRGIYIVDIAPLQQLTAPVLATQVHLFESKPATVFAPQAGKAAHGPEGTPPGKNFLAPNPEYGAAIWYWVKERLEQPGSLILLDSEDRQIWQAEIQGEPGLHRFQWPLRRAMKPDAPLVPPGEYRAVLTLAGKKCTQKVRVEE